MTPRHSRNPEISSLQIRSAMLGRPDDHLRIARQAYRMHDDDTDELSLICVGGTVWWVAQRISDQLTVWAYADEDAAADGFERQAASSAAWVEAGAQ